jgi:predicted AAA+ superfamily ATPase
VLNYTSLAGTFGLSKKTVEECIRYFEDVFLLKRIDKFHNKPKEQIKSSKKVYVLDNGFLQAAPKHSEDSGKSLENAVFIKLNQECERLSYLKDIYEVDFYTGEVLYQVAYDISNEKTRKRELRSFEHFPQSEDKPCRLVTYEGNESADGVEVVSFGDFLLSPVA